MINNRIINLSSDTYQLSFYEFIYPDELLTGDVITSDVSNSNTYTVPPDKRLYILNSYQSYDLLINNVKVYDANSYGATLSNPIIAEAGDIISYANSSYSGYGFNAILIDKNSEYDVITSDVSNSNTYTVPPDKRLYILNSYQSYDLLINNVKVYDANSYGATLSNPIIAEAGDIISYANSSYSGYGFNGVLVDENYFANFNTESYESSYLDSAFVADMIANSLVSGNSKNLKYPEGTSSNTLHKRFYEDDSYTVPGGKNLYVTSIFQQFGNGNFKVNEKTLIDGPINSQYNTSNGKSQGGPWIFSQGDILSANNGTHISGFLTDANVSPITIDGLNDISFNTSEGQIFVMLNIFSNNNNFSVNDQYFFGGESNSSYQNPQYSGVSTITTQPIIFNSTDVITSNSNSTTLNGYLVDDDYFANQELSTSQQNSQADNSTNINVIYTTPFYSIDSLNLNEYEIGEIIIDKGMNSSYYVSETFNNESYSTLLLDQPSCSSVGKNEYMFYFEVTDTLYYQMPYKTIYQSDFGEGAVSGSWSSYQCDPLSNFNNIYYLTSIGNFDPNSHVKLTYNYDYLIPGIGYIMTLSNSVPGSYYGAGAPAYSSLTNFEFNNSYFTNMSFWNKSSNTYIETNYFPVLTGLGFKVSQPIRTLIPLND